MAKQIKLPELGENILSGDILDVMVVVGDHVEKDQPIMELETEKATLEVPSPQSGKIVKILVEAGQVVEVGQPVLEMEEEASQPGPTPVVESESQDDKITAEVPAKEPENPVSVETQGIARKSDGRFPVPAPPSVRKFAREIGINLADVKGTGPGGRISMDDVKTYSRLTRHQPTEVPTGPTVGAPVKLPDFTAYGTVTREKMSKIRKVTARSMAQSWSQLPHVTLHRTVMITELENQRRQLKQRGSQNLTFTAMIIKIAAHALKRFPTLNATLDLASEEIIFKEYRHIGVAVDTPKGLVVPVIRDADLKNIQSIADELTYLSERARAGKLSLSEMSGASFTITNLGGLGTEHFTPIINFPESAILGVGRGQVQPVWNGTEFEPQTMLPLSLSFDHRLIDGAEGARFMQWLADAMAHPLLMALEG